MFSSQVTATCCSQRGSKACWAAKSPPPGVVDSMDDIDVSNDLAKAGSLAIVETWSCHRSR